ncbi:hypothetical protein TVAG_477320 [Trichomonas vaginalis G3]|uniref:Uncharacterized protein n=1 Tax=Trichomonas vaginalis (strain ATCC PRA-98 / G3) TaxID=412133 RepID=A2F9E0_TRIV3|nr:hypothetical protein TVAGG3_1029300 [Trichomonas vaginalis G3]EAX98459.1 hypothetical protein TVAG_477320 [Trichomonas vaginalis G3]KAI5492734.1 hypothetical protein TVAGG3_1029300 [Trichomonas vaginalis G3]|eukprot:XP_001311389.1 hypothetical protein [Trichomonas vaginalis G3]
MIEYSEVDSVSTTDSFSTECSNLKQNLCELQTAIIRQAQDVENFIQQHENSSGKSKSFIILQTLFKSFKTEISLNLTLRQELVKARQNNQELCNEIEKQKKFQRKLYKSISKVSNKSLSSVGQIIEYVKNLENEKLRAKEYSETIKVITSQNQDKEAQLSLDIAHLQSCVERLESEKQQLSSKIQYNTIYTQNKDKIIDDLQKKIKDFETKYTESEEKRHKCEELLKKAESVLKTATKKAKQYKSERDKIMNYVNTLEVIESRYKKIYQDTEPNNQQVPQKEQIQDSPEDLLDADDLLNCINSLQGDIGSLKNEFEQLN